jgi:hypothetical protein
MPWRNWNDDEDLLRDIAGALRPEPGEGDVLQAARAVHAWRDTDVERELAELLYDSYVDRVAGVRAAPSGAHRSLVFALGELRVEVEVSDSGIEGQLIPPEPGVVRLVGVAGPLAETTADEVGCFTFPTGRQGPIRIECEVDGHRVATEWITA